MLVFRAGDRMALRAGPRGARVLLLGGAAMDGPRHLFWNFVSSSRERIEQAKADWKAGRFSKVPGDEAEFIPLPEERVSARAEVQRLSEGSPTGSPPSSMIRAGVTAVNSTGWPGENTTITPSS